MISYRDKTFCINWEGCKQGKRCHRALTQDVTDKALIIGLPVCLARFPADKCEEWKREY